MSMHRSAPHAAVGRAGHDFQGIRAPRTFPYVPLRAPISRSTIGWTSRTEAARYEYSEYPGARLGSFRPESVGAPGSPP